jgi:hypothetical protein
MTTSAEQQLRAQREHREVKDLRQRIKLLEANRTRLEGLLTESIRAYERLLAVSDPQAYLDLDKCPPAWLAEAQKTGRIKNFKRLML